MKVTELLELVRVRLGVASAQWRVDVDQVAEHQAPPVYIWVPTRDAFGPPERIGGNPRALYTREAGLELHLWASSVDDAETRMLAVINALHAEARTSVMLQAANWSGQSIVGRGVLLTLELRVKIPVTRAAAAVGQAETVQPDTCLAAPGDGKLDWGETT